MSRLSSRRPRDECGIALPWAVVEDVSIARRSSLGICVGIMSVD